MKYRIFQKSTKKYVEDTREYALMPDGTLIYNYSGWEWAILDYPDDFAIERFTGLMDSNGKDIYEGDVVSVNDSLWFSKFNKFDNSDDTFPKAYYDLLDEFDKWSDENKYPRIYNVYETFKFVDGSFEGESTKLDITYYNTMSYMMIKGNRHEMRILGNIHDEKLKKLIGEPI